MVREMEEKGMVPDAITYNILINGSAQVLSSLAYCDLDSEINHLWYTHFVARKIFIGGLTKNTTLGSWRIAASDV
ncbi:hypothetical protein ABKV19_000474 [Rosa sericea]